MSDENYYNQIINEYPLIVSKDQMYRICNISKKTAEFLLKSGVVPCEDTGMKTRRFKVKLVDIIDYLRKRNDMPDQYLAPNGWYGSKSNKKAEINVPLSQGQLDNMRWYITDILADCPDVLTTPQIEKAIGYSSGAIYRWCSRKLLHCFIIRNAYLIPKDSLIVFMMGTYYSSIVKKSTKHKEMLAILKQPQ